MPKLSLMKSEDYTEIIRARRLKDIPQTKVRLSIYYGIHQTAPKISESQNKLQRIEAFAAPNLADEKRFLLVRPCGGEFDTQPPLRMLTPLLNLATTTGFARHAMPTASLSYRSDTPYP